MYLVLTFSSISAKRCLSEASHSTSGWSEVESACSVQRPYSQVRCVCHSTGRSNQTKETRCGSYHTTDYTNGIKISIIILLCPQNVIEINYCSLFSHLLPLSLSLLLIGVLRYRNSRQHHSHWSLHLVPVSSHCCYHKWTDPQRGRAFISHNGHNLICPWTR